MAQLTLFVYVYDLAHNCTNAIFVNSLHILASINCLSVFNIVISVHYQILTFVLNVIS